MDHAAGNLGLPVGAGQSITSRGWVEMCRERGRESKRECNGSDQCTECEAN